MTMTMMIIIILIYHSNKVIALFSYQRNDENVKKKIFMKIRFRICIDHPVHVCVYASVLHK